MNKREFIKATCALGMCSCAAPVLFGSEVAEAPKEAEDCDKIKDMNRRLNWRVNHAKGQLGLLLSEIEDDIPLERREQILEKMGRNCVGSLGWAEKYKNNPEGFFEHMKQHSGENITYDREKGLIRVVTRDRDCDCPIVDSSKTPAYYCHCSIGWQKQVYETILGKKIEVNLVESVLRGSSRCVFEVHVS